MYIYERIKPRPPALQADSLPAEPPGKAVYVCVLHICFQGPSTSLSACHMSILVKKKKITLLSFLHSSYKKMQILLEVYFWTSQESVGTTDKHTHTKIH